MFSTRLRAFTLPYSLAVVRLALLLQVVVHLAVLGAAPRRFHQIVPSLHSHSNRAARTPMSRLRVLFTARLFKEKVFGQVARSPRTHSTSSASLELRAALSALISIFHLSCRAFILFIYCHVAFCLERATEGATVKRNGRGQSTVSRCCREWPLLTTTATSTGEKQEAKENGVEAGRCFSHLKSTASPWPWISSPAMILMRCSRP